MKTDFCRWGLVLALGLMTSSAFAVPAGRILMAVGEVKALRNGVSVKLDKESLIESGDTIQTGESSNAQLRFTDGSIVALRPETHFLIEGYNFRSSDPSAKSDSGIFSLLKGGLRTISGLIGKVNRENYTMKTPTATVGIRGTHYNLVLCQQNCRNNDGTTSRDGLYGSVLDGAIVLKNQASESRFGKDEVFYVPDTRTPPEKLIAPPSFLRDRLDGQARSKKGEQGAQKTQDARGEGQQKNQQQANNGQTQQQTGGPDQTPQAPQAPVESPRENQTPTLQGPNLSNSNVVFTENRTQQGTSSVLGSSTPSSSSTSSSSTQFVGQGNGTAPTTGVSSRVVIAEYNASSGSAHNAVDSVIDTTLTTDSQGILSFWNGQFSRGTASVYENGADSGAIIWGRWANGTMSFAGWGAQTLTSDQGQHIIYGVIPTSFPNQNAVTFSLIGATRPTETTNTSSGNVWSISSGSVTANFLAQTYSGTLGIGLTSARGQSAYSMAFTSGTLTYNSTNAWTGTVSNTGGAQNICGGTCAASGTLIFAGANSSHAGTTYEFALPSTTYVQGVAVFKR